MRHFRTDASGDLGLLDDTLVLFGSEFGRMPTAQGPDGRDFRLTDVADNVADNVAREIFA